MARTRTRSTANSPQGRPPEANGGTATLSPGASRPAELSDEQVAQAQAPPAEARPTVEPPEGLVSGAAGVAAEGVTATWRTGMTVTALWSINEVRNAWMHVNGLGWRKIYNGRDGAFTALTTLASQARQTGKPINFREEADGMVYEIYLW